MFVCLKEKIVAVVFLAISLLLNSSHLNAEQFDSESSFGDFTIGYKSQTLEADVIEDAYVKTTGLNILSMSFTPNISPVLGAFLSYELTPGNSSEQDELIALQNQSENNGWQRFLANIRFKVSDGFGFGFRYDDQSFLNSVQSKRDLWFVTPTTAQLLVPGDNVTVATVFTDTELYISLIDDHSSYDIGMFTTEYSKPLATDALTTVTTLFESDLEATGLFFRASNIRFGNHWRLTAVFKYAFEPEIKIDGQNLGVLTGGSISTVNSLTYLEYGFALSYQNTIISMPVRLNIDYKARQFDDIVEDIQIADDRIIGVSVSFLLSI